MRFWDFRFIARIVSDITGDPSIPPKIDRVMRCIQKKTLKNERSNERRRERAAELEYDDFEPPAMHRQDRKFRRRRGKSPKNSDRTPSPRPALPKIPFGRA